MNKTATHMRRYVRQTAACNNMSTVMPAVKTNHLIDFFYYSFKNQQDAFNKR